MGNKIFFFNKEKYNYWPSGWEKKNLFVFFLFVFKLVGEEEKGEGTLAKTAEAIAHHNQQYVRCTLDKLGPEALLETSSCSDKS